MASLFDKLKKKSADIAQGVYRDVNVWDGGASHSNPNPQAKQQLIKQQQLQQVQNSPNISPARKQSITGMLNAPKQKFDLGGAINQSAQQTVKPVADFAQAPFKPVVKGLAATYDLSRAGIGQATGNKVARNNALKATRNDYNDIYNQAAGMGRDWVARPAVQIGATLANPTKGNNNVVRPTNPVTKYLLGDKPVQSIQAGVRSNYQEHPNLPTPVRMGLAGGYGALQVANDLPVVGGVLKPLKGAKTATKVEKTVQSKPVKSPLTPEDTLHIQTAQKAYDVETNPTRKAQIGQYLAGLPQRLAEQNKKMGQGGYIRLSDGKDITPSKNKTADIYGISHRPVLDHSAPGHDLSMNGEFVPKDIYTNPEYYSNIKGNASDPFVKATNESFSAIKAIKDNPNAEITIYRAGPKNELNAGDWVTPSETYANMHAEQQGAKVHAYKVKANELRWPGDDLNEFGFFPIQSKASDLKQGLVKVKNALKLPNDQGGHIQLPGKGEKAPKGAPIEKTPKETGVLPYQEVPIESQKLVNLPKSKIEQPVLGQTVTREQVAPSETPFDTNKYITEQNKLQKQAEGKRGLFGKARTDIATKAIDSLSPIEKPVEKIVGRQGTLKLRDQLDRSLRADTISGRYIKDNSLDKTIQSVADTKALDQYLIARHAKDLEANGIKTGRDLSKDNLLVEQLSPQYEQAAQQINKYNSDLLDKTVDYGLISRETASMLKEKYPNYVPFDRIFSEEELLNKGGRGGGVASLSQQTVVQRIRGSERQINSPLENILAKTHDVIAQGEKNLAAREIVATKDLPGNPLGLKEIKSTETIGNRDTISFIDNGVKRVFETTPEVAAAAKSLNKTQLGLIGKIFSYPTRALRLGATGVNVGFTAANIVKDVVTAGINSEHPIRGSIANPQVFMDALAASFWHSGKNYAELTRHGAGGTSFDVARDAARSTVKRIRADKNVGTRTLYTVTHPSELLRAVEDTIGRSEEFGRAAQYFGNKRVALSEGKSIQEATAYGADAARNNVTNFARAGEYGRVLNSVLPYLNAGVQGSRTFMRNMRDRPAQTATKVAITGFIPVAAATAWNLNDPKRKEAYDDIAEYEKQGNIIIIPPNPKKDPKTGKWNAIKIPMSQEVANLNGIVRNGVEALSKDKNFDFGRMVAELTGTATSLNVGSGREIMNQTTPQAIKPLIETTTNQNLYTGNKIVPDSKKNLANQDQYGDGTSGTAKVIGKLTNTSPYMLDNAVRTTFAGAGQNAINATDNLLAKAGVISKDDIRGKSLSSGITSRFSGAAGSSGYDTADKILAAAQKELYKNPDFKKLSQEDRAKELNRLKTDVTAAEVAKYDAKFQQGQFAPDYTGKANKLSKNQSKLVTSGLNVSDYTKSGVEKALSSEVTIAPTLNKEYADTLTKYAAMTTDEREADFSKLPEAEYQYNKAKFENDRANGKVTKAQELTQLKSLKKDKVGADYSKDVRDLYEVSEKDLGDYLRTEEKGVDKKKIYDQLIAYDLALKNAGIIKTAKFKNGIANSSSGGGGSGRGLKLPTVTVPKSVNTRVTVAPVKKPVYKKTNRVAKKR